MNKEANTRYPVIPLIKKRWSPRAFSERSVDIEDLHTMFEAASWAASSSNEQPWQYVYALKGTSGFDGILNCLNPSNIIWAKNAAVLIVCLKVNNLSKSGKPNTLAMHDLGLANANLILQGVSLNIYSHPMAGFSKDKVNEILRTDDKTEAVCVIASGYIGDAESLEEPNREREKETRKRKPLTDIIKEYSAD